MSPQSIEPETEAEDRGGSGATAAQRGFEYQLNVSVLAALRMMLVTKSAARITLEPANEDDLEADLQPYQPGRVQPGATLSSGHRLVVQVKLNSGEPWSIADFDALLNHGTRRTPAKDHLDDLNVHYLLVTSADAKGVARDLLVRDFEEASDPADFPSSLSETLPNQPGGRVAIWGGLTERLVELETERILGDLLRVPKTAHADCWEALRREARRRMSGSVPGVWTREDLVGTIRSHGGHLASSAHLDAFVPPANFSGMVAQLTERNAVVISGPSGPGKTIAAQALCDEARLRNGLLDVVTVSAADDPARMRRLIDTGPVLFYIEDPWGQYSLGGQHEAWTDQLPRLLRSAGPDHQYVVTSRSDMLGQARATDKLGPWSILLEADQYRDGQLSRIYDKRMDLLPAAQQSKALEFRPRVLDELETPMELDLFFTNLGEGPLGDELDPEFLRRLLEVSHRDAVENIVVSTLAASDSFGMAAVVWGLLAGAGQFDRAQLLAVQRQLRALNEPIGDGLGRLIDRLIATRHLRQPSQTVSFAHPSVRAGFETFLREDWLRHEAALQTLVDALLKLPAGLAAWGIETAARVIEVSRSFAEDVEGALGFEVRDASQAQVDAWLETMLVAPDSDFQPVLQLAADVGSHQSIPSELARWFIKGVQRGANLWLNDWKPPKFDDDWYRRVAEDPRSATIADRFIRKQLPHDTSMFGPRFAQRLDRIATGLEPAFIDAAHQMVGLGFDRNIDAIAAGAVRDLDGFEAVLNEACDDLAAIRQAHASEGALRWREIEDGERDAGYEDYFQSAHEDDGYASDFLVGAYLSAMREAGRWRELIAHPRGREVALPWARMAGRAQNADAAEINAILDATARTGDEAAAWEAARLNWDASLAPRLLARLFDKVEGGDIRRELAQCALVASRSTLIEAFAKLADDPATSVSLLVDVKAAQSLIGSKNRAAALKPVLKALTPEAREIFDALPYRKHDASAVGERALTMLERAAATMPLPALDAILPVMMASGAKPTAAIARLLSSEEAAPAARAVDAAISIGAEELVQSALQHKRADARLAALKHLGPLQPSPFPSAFLAFSRDPGSRVRKALVELLALRPHPDHFAVLLRLTGDEWSDAQPQYNEPHSYPIARDAVDALRAYGALDEAVADQLIGLARKTADRVLRQKALDAAAALGTPENRKRIWTLVADKALGWLRVDALDALWSAPFVEPDLVVSVRGERIFRLAAPLAASATIFAAKHLPVADAVALLEDIAHRNSHRALLLLGVLSLSDRDRGEAERALNLLEEGHPARALMEEGSVLPATALDDLGDIRIRKHVRLWLGDRIGKA